MALDSIANGSVPPFNKDYGKKKKGNRLAKLKQCKLDARREQWLSQAKNKVNKEELNGCGGGRGGSVPTSYLANEGSQVMESTKTVAIVEENEGLSLHDSDLESLTNSTLSIDSRKDRPGSSCGSSSSGCCSGNFSEEEEEDDDGCLDDWEAVADALCAHEKLNEQNVAPQCQQQIEEPIAPAVPDKGSVVTNVKSECRIIIPQAAPIHRCAWRPDDAFRPLSLPNLSKQRGFTMKQEQCHLVYDSNAWVRNSTVSTPTSCPICYEDLDVTDSSFLPCVCGFRLCLFCYKRIFEVGDGRCPGCRRSYNPADGNAVVNGAAQPVVDGPIQAGHRLSRSRSMSARSGRKVAH